MFCYTSKGLSYFSPHFQALSFTLPSLTQPFCRDKCPWYKQDRELSWDRKLQSTEWRCLLSLSLWVPCLTSNMQIFFLLKYICGCRPLFFVGGTVIIHLTDFEHISCHRVTLCTLCRQKQYFTLTNMIHFSDTFNLILSLQKDLHASCA